MNIEDEISSAIVLSLQKAVKGMDEVEEEAITRGFVNAIRFTGHEWGFNLADRIVSHLLFPNISATES